MHAPALPQLGDPFQHRVGAFGALDCKHVAVGNHGSLADIEASDRPKDFHPQRDIVEVRRRRLTLGQIAFRHQDAGRDFVRANDTKAVAFCDPAHTLEQMIIPAAEGRDDRGQHH